MEDLLAKGSSIYHRLVSLYTCRSDGTLLSCTNNILQGHWSEFRALRMEDSSNLSHTAIKHLDLPLAAYSDELASDSASSSTSGAYLERKHANGDSISGIIIRTKDLGKLEALDEFFVDLVLRSTKAAVPEVDAVVDVQEHVIDEIVDLFDDTIRNVTPDDQWSTTGRQLFRSRVEHFASRGMKIELALPAFPCKSSNSNKVGGNLPDRGELLALTTLHEFVMDIERLYEPGATVLIVSDGHVFSDCIGVDDGMVDEYSKHLHEMNNTLSANYGDANKKRVQFQSLTDMLQLSSDGSQGQDLAQELGLDTITHHIAQVNVNDDAEVCRRLLMQGFRAKTDQLRERIDNKDPNILKLYRGFSRFMLEDLEKNDYTKDLSKSQRRKISSKVAFEMIERNQAYSNLVEMIFPYHVRLSIHAHNNAGPKFGINLMPPQVRATNTLPPEGKDAESCDLLHIPTPWHGCVVEIAGDSHLYLAKVEQVKEAIQEEKVLAAWVEPAVEETVAGTKQRSRSNGSKSISDTDVSDAGLSDAGSSDTSSSDGDSLDALPIPTAAHFTLIPAEKQYVV